LSHYITCAIDYPNGPPHLGHAYEKIGADLLARYLRLSGRDAFLTVGLDEHSTQLERRAAEQGVTPQAFVDAMEPLFREAYDLLGVSYDAFIRSSSQANRQTAQTVIQRVYDAGHIYKGKYLGWFCPSCNRFYGEDELLPGHVCPVHNRPTELLEEENYFFRLSAFADRLRRHFEEHPDFVQPPPRRSEMLGVLDAGLRDVSISRSSTRWGISLPWDPDHVIYVWFDALLCYCSAIGFADDPQKFERYWPAWLHVIGKDITRFHTLMWPAMLMAAGLALPERVFSHGFITLGGQRLSKSSGITVDPFDLARRFGADAVRYVLMREVPFDRDGDWSAEAFADRYNADLANDYGNLVSRSTNMVERYLGGVTPELVEGGALERELRDVWESVLPQVERSMLALGFSDALAAVGVGVNRTNKYIEESRPWALHKQGDEQRLRCVLAHVLEGLRLATLLIAPAMPSTADRVQQQCGFDSASPWPRRARWGALSAGAAVRTGPVLFPRLEREA
jgi:methionyl-tRNA synthetase